MTPTVWPPTHTAPQLPPQQIWLLLPRFQNYTSSPLATSPAPPVWSQQARGQDPEPSIQFPLFTCQLVHTPLFLEPGRGSRPPTGAQSAWMEGHHHCSWVSLISGHSGTPPTSPPGFPWSGSVSRAQGCSEVDKTCSTKAPEGGAGWGLPSQREKVLPFIYISPLPPAAPSHRPPPLNQLPEETV